MPVAFRMQGFTGAVPRTEYRLLPDNAATVATDVLLTSGRVDPMFEPNNVANNVAGTADKSVYRMYSGATDYWLAWAADVDAVRSPVTDDASFRLYFTSDEFEPRVTNLAMATGAAPYPNSWYVLGVTPPVTAPTVAAVGGSGTAENRAYIYSFVTSWGEESEPSPAGTAAGFVNSTSWTLTGITAPTNSGTISAATYLSGVVTVTLNTVFGLRAGEYITFAGVAGMTDLNGTHKLLSVDPALNKVTVALTTAQTYSAAADTWTRVAPHNLSGWTVRIYRAASGTTGASNFYFVMEMPIAGPFSDTVTGANLGEACPSATWVMPPVDLQGLISLPGGVMAGFRGNELCFSEPYRPYAWPLQYRMNTDAPIVGIGSFGQTVVVGTEGVPHVASGTEPAYMSMSKLTYAWPCLSKRGMASFGGHVFFPTQLGLAAVGVSGERIVTDKTYTQIEWGALSPSTFIAAHHNNIYYARRSGDQEEVIAISAESGVVTLNRQPAELWSDPVNGKLYAQLNGNIYDYHPDTGARVFGTWRSKEFVFANPVNLGAMRVNAKFSLTPAEQAAVVSWNAAITAENAATIALGNQAIGRVLGSSQVNGVRVAGSNLRTDFKQDGGSIGVTVWADDVALYAVNVTDQNMFRLPSGMKYDNIFVQVSSDVPVQSIAIAETAVGLKAV